MYINDMNSGGINVSHIEEVLENNPSREELYGIWLGNSMNTPTPINTKQDLIDALEISYSKGGDIKNLSEESKKAKANAKYYNESYVVYSEDGKAINIAKETWDDLSPKAKEGRELIEKHLSSYDKGKKK